MAGEVHHMDKARALSVSSTLWRPEDNFQESVPSFHQHELCGSHLGHRAWWHVPLPTGPFTGSEVASFYLYPQVQLISNLCNIYKGLLKASLTWELLTCEISTPAPRQCVKTWKYYGKFSLFHPCSFVGIFKLQALDWNWTRTIHDFLWGSTEAWFETTEV